MIPNKNRLCSSCILIEDKNTIYISKNNYLRNDYLQKAKTWDDCLNYDTTCKKEIEKHHIHSLSIAPNQLEYT